MASSPACIDLPLLNYILVTSLAHEEQQKGSEQEEYTVHDAECKARLEHRTSLVDAPREWAISFKPIRPNRNEEASIEAKATAVRLGNGS